MNSIHGFFSRNRTRFAWRKCWEYSERMEEFRKFWNFFSLRFCCSLRRKLRPRRWDKGNSKCKSYLYYLQRITDDCDFIIHRGWLWPLIFIAGLSLSFNIVERKPVLWNFHANLFTRPVREQGVNQPRLE